MQTQEKLKLAVAAYEKDFDKNGITVRGGKKYGTVNQRLKAFRTYFPDASITTDVIKNERVQVKKLETEVVVMKCTISLDGQVISTGIAEEFREGSSPVNVTSFWENCETSAIGRSLANLGFSGQEFASYDEIQIAEAKSQAINGSGTMFDKFTAAIQNAKHIGHLKKTSAEYKHWLDGLNKEDKDIARNIWLKRKEQISSLQEGKVIHD